MDTKGPPVEVDEMPLEALDLKASDRAMDRTAKWWEGRPQEQKDKELEDLKRMQEISRRLRAQGPHQPETIAECWEAFARDVVPTGAPEVQVRDMRRCFYNGCFALLGLMMEIREHGNVEAGAQLLAKYQQELVDFQARIEVDR